MPDEILLLSCASLIAATAAAIKAVWHNCQLRRGGAAPLGMFHQLFRSQEDRRR